VLITISLMPVFTYPSKWPYNHGLLQSFEVYKYFRAPWIGTCHVSTRPRHLSSGPPSWPPSPSSDLRYKKAISDARHPSTWVLHSALHTLREHIHFWMDPWDIPTSPCPRCTVMASRMTDNTSYISQCRLSSSKPHLEGHELGIHITR
jgi:hypothetical protein